MSQTENDKLTTQLETTASSNTAAAAPVNSRLAADLDAANAARAVAETRVAELEAKLRKVTDHDAEVVCIPYRCSQICLLQHSFH